MLTDTETEIPTSPSLSTFPFELIASITIHLSTVQDLINLSSTSRHIHAALSVPSFRAQWWIRQARYQFDSLEVANILAVPVFDVSPHSKQNEAEKPKIVWNINEGDYAFPMQLLKRFFPLALRLPEQILPGGPAYPPHASHVACVKDRMSEVNAMTVYAWTRLVPGYIRNRIIHEERGREVGKKPRKEEKRVLKEAGVPEFLVTGLKNNNTNNANNAKSKSRPINQYQGITSTPSDAEEEYAFDFDDTFQVDWPSLCLWFHSFGLSLLPDGGLVSALNYAWLTQHFNEAFLR
ncbi:hypothetical protein HK102_010823, partial [Quaeritorhiza haematococci]